MPEKTLTVRAVEGSRNGRGKGSGPGVPLSTNRRIQAAMPTIMKGRESISFDALRRILTEKLGTKLRVDYLVGNLLGMKGYWIDCEERILWRYRE